MKNQIKVFAATAFFTVLSITVLAAPKASALTLDDILNSPKVLGDSTSNGFPYPTASLVKDGSAIYFISGTSKVPFTNYKAFIGLGYSLKNVVNGDLSNYSSSQAYVISTANARHPWGSWVSYKGVIYYLTQDGMIGVPSSAVFLSNGGQWRLVVAANKYDIAILKANSSLPVLTVNDSRIIGQPVFQFGGSGSTNNSAPVPSPVQTITATPTVVSFVPQLVLPANIYASSSATFSAPSSDPNGTLIYTFDWDDGTPANSLAVSAAVHTYYITGVYMLNVSVIDSLKNTF